MGAVGHVTDCKMLVGMVTGLVHGTVDGSLFHWAVFYQQFQYCDVDESW